MILALTVGALVAGAAWLLLDRDYLRTILGLLMLGHAANLVLMSAGGIQRRDEPIYGAGPAEAADPLPQAFVLTAIVIAFAIVIVMVVLSVTGRGADDEPDDEPSPDGPDDGTHNGSRPPAERRVDASGGAS